MIFLAFGQIVLRNIFDTGFIWIDPLLRVMVLWIGLLGALVATRENKQISIDVLTRLLTPRQKAISQIITRLFAASVSGLIAWHALWFVIDEWSVGDTAFANIPAWLLEAVIPLGFGVIALRYLCEVVSGIYWLIRGEVT
jgi:TRAP-type C4-dicarboxylate transport system permease small subunit